MEGVGDEQASHPWQASEGCQGGLCLHLVGGKGLGECGALGSVRVPEGRGRSNSPGAVGSAIFLKRTRLMRWVRPWDSSLAFAHRMVRLWRVGWLGPPSCSTGARERPRWSFLRRLVGGSCFIGLLCPRSRKQWRWLVLKVIFGERLSALDCGPAIPTWSSRTRRSFRLTWWRRKVNICWKFPRWWNTWGWVLWRRVASVRAHCWNGGCHVWSLPRDWGCWSVGLNVEGEASRVISASENSEVHCSKGCEEKFQNRSRRAEETYQMPPLWSTWTLEPWM